MACTTVIRWIFTIALYPVIIVLLFARNILAVWGEFVRGRPVLIHFYLRPVYEQRGWPQWLSMMTEHQYLTLLNQVSSGILNVILNLIFILEFEFLGAAIATASTLTLINLVRVVKVRYLEEMSPYNATYLKPLLAGLFSCIPMYGLSIFLDSYLLIGVPVLVWGSVFLGVLYLLGIEQAEKDVFERLIFWGSPTPAGHGSARRNGSHPSV